MGDSENGAWWRTVVIDEQWRSTLESFLSLDWNGECVHNEFGLDSCPRATLCNKRSLEKAFDSDPVSDREGGNGNVPLRSMTGTSRTFSISKGVSYIYRLIEVPLCNSLLTVTILLDCCPCAWQPF